MTCTRFFRSFCRAEEGAFTFLLIFFILGSMMALGVSVDSANAMRKGEQMQYTANAVALAAAQDLPVKENAIDAGLAIAALNLAQTNNIAAVGQSDIRVGNFDAATGMFTVDVQPFNAVDVRVVRDANRGNALVTYLARLAGRPSYDIDVRAVALATGGGAPCSSGGFFSNDRVYSGRNNDCTNGFCLYGRLGVKISSDNSFEEGVKVEMPRLRDFEQGGSNAGIDNALNENEYPNLADAYNSVPGIVASLQAGDLSVLRSHLNITEVKYREKIEESDLPLEENTLYIVDDVADFGSDQTIKNIAVVAVKEVKMGSNN